MNEMALSLVAAVGRTTLLLAGAAAVVAIVLCATRPASPWVHRAAWSLVLFQGLLWFRVPVAIPYEAPANPTPEVVAETVSPRLPFDDSAAAPRTDAMPPSHRLTMTPLSDSSRGVASQGRAQEASQVALAPPLPSGTALAEASEPAAPEPSAADWSLIAAVAWLGGMGLIVAVWLIGYVGFVLLVSRAKPAPEEWSRQWQAIVAARGIRRRIPLRVAKRIGPVLCRLPWGYELVVPAGLWQRATPAGRQGILRHELTHLARGDVWKSLLVRLAALPHWFNPLAWHAVRQFDEAAEWACDTAAIATDRAGAAEYAKTLLLLGESAGQLAALRPAATGHGLSQRIRRLVTSHPTEDPVMKKLVVIGVGVTFVLVCLVRLELVAQVHSGSEALAGQPPAESVLVPADDALKPVDLAPGAGAVGPAAGPPRIDQAMLSSLLQQRRDTLERSAERALQSYQTGKTPAVTLVSIYADLHQAELALAKTPQERIAAHLRHLKHLEPIAKTVEAQVLAGVAGGEAADHVKAELFGAQAAVLGEQLSQPAGIALAPVTAVRLVSPGVPGTGSVAVVSSAGAGAPGPMLGIMTGPPATAGGGGPSGMMSAPANAAQPGGMVPGSMYNPVPLAAVDATTGLDPRQLCYEGKSFGQWQRDLVTELSPNRRTQAVRAFAVFGAHGLGREAAVQVVAIMRQYDVRFTDDSPIGRLKQAAREAFKGKIADSNALEAIDPKAALPVVVNELTTGPRNGRLFAATVLKEMGREALPALPLLVAVVRTDKDLDVRTEALTTVAMLDQSGETTVTLLREAIQAADSGPAIAFISQMPAYGNTYPWMPLPYTPTGMQRWIDRSNRIVEPILEAAKSSQPELRLTAINSLASLGANSPKVCPVLLELLAQAKPEDPQFSMILQTLMQLRIAAKDAVPVLEKMLPNSKGRARQAIEYALQQLGRMLPPGSDGSAMGPGGAFGGMGSMSGMGMGGGMMSGMGMGGMGGMTGGMGMSGMGGMMGGPGMGSGSGAGVIAAPTGPAGGAGMELKTAPKAGTKLPTKSDAESAPKPTTKTDR